MSAFKKPGILSTVLSALLAVVILSRVLISSHHGTQTIAHLAPDYQGLGTPPTATIWLLPDYPAIEAMREDVVHAFRLCEVTFERPEGSVYGLLPAREYGMIFVRDTSTMMPALQYFYADPYLRTPVEEFLRHQYGPSTESLDGTIPGDGAISGVLAPDGHSDKATVVSDEESHLIHAAYLYYHTTGGPSWLQKQVQGEAIILRLNRALDWLYAHRFDTAHGLVKRGHTTDWGDIKFEPAVEPTDLEPSTDHWTFSIYDQALAYRALQELAEMNEDLGDEARARELDERAQQLRLATNANLWSPQGGFYVIHTHLTPLVHPFPEEQMVGIGNAVAAYVGLTDPTRAQEIFASLEGVRLAAGAGKPGTSLYPPYPKGFFAQAQMLPGEYQNGGLWDWWAGAQITAEFEGGYSSLAFAHLRMVAEDWVRHPRQIFEWQMPQTNKGQGASNYASAAATMAEATVRGLFGVTIDRGGVRLQPRLRKHEGQIRVLQPASGFYASYNYRYEPDCVTLSYGSNHPGGVRLKLLLPPEREIRRVSLDGLVVSHSLETQGEDSYCVLKASSGVHQVQVTFNEL